MEKKQWVQHVSGQGEKWEVVVDNAGNAYQWWVRSGPAPCGWHYLPKSEYALCDPPEVWRDVTEFVQVVSRGEYSNLVYNGENVRVDNGGYRLRKVQLWNDYGTKSTKQWAFIVEQKVTQ